MWHETTNTATNYLGEYTNRRRGGFQTDTPISTPPGYGTTRYNPIAAAMMPQSGITSVVLSYRADVSTQDPWPSNGRWHSTGDQLNCAEIENDARF